MTTINSNNADICNYKFAVGKWERSLNMSVVPSLKFELLMYY
jgi:hypothetical protein